MARLLVLMAERLRESDPMGARLLNWPGDPSPMGDVLGLRLAGGLHGLVLRGEAPGLSAVYPPHETTDDALWEAVLTAFAEHAGPLEKALQSPPQTNEVRRSAALLPGLGVIARMFGLPMMLSEVGASAGLNLGLDRFRLETKQFGFGAENPVLTLRPEWSGGTPDMEEIEISGRQGCDLLPIDLSSKSEQARLLSYIWPDQPERLALTRAAIEAAHHEVVGEHAINFLTRRLAEPCERHVQVIMHSIAWQYLSAEDRAEGDAIIAAARRGATRSAPVARLAMEADGSSEGAALTLQTWPGGEWQELARVDFHGRWVRWE